MVEAKRQFSLGWLLLATFVAAWFLAVNDWLGDVYGWRTSIACVVFAGMIALVNWRTYLGAIVGAVVLAVIGYLFVLDPWPVRRFYMALMLFLSYGAAIGSGAHAILLGHRLIGSIASVLSAIAFGVILWIN